MALIQNGEEFLRKKVEQGIGPLPRSPTGEMAAVVLNPAAGPHLFHQVEVILGSHLQALGLQQLPGQLELSDPLRELRPDRRDRPFHLVPRRHVMLGRSENLPQRFAELLAGNRIKSRQPVDRVSQQLHPDGGILVGQQDLDGVSPDPELPPLRRRVIPLVLDFHQPGEQLLPGNLLSRLQGQNHPLVILG